MRMGCFAVLTPVAESVKRDISEHDRGRQGV